MVKLNRIKRRLLSGKMVNESNQMAHIKVNTHCPMKWAIVDMETGDIWMHSRKEGFKPLLAELIPALKAAVKDFEKHKKED